MPSPSNSVHPCFSPGGEFSSSQQQAQHKSIQIGLSHGTLSYPNNNAPSVFVHKDSRERNNGFRNSSRGFDMRHGDDATVLCPVESDGGFSPLPCASPHHDHINPHHSYPRHVDIHVQHPETHPHHQHHPRTHIQHFQTHAQHSLTHMHANPQHPHPHAYSHPYPRSHTHPYEGGGLYPHLSPDLCAPQPHHQNANANANPSLDVQPHSQQHISLEEIMSHDLLPHSNHTPSSSYTQGCDVNGIAVGVPVMGKPIYMDNCSHLTSPSPMHQLQQCASPWQPSYRQNPPVMETVPQGCLTAFMSSHSREENNPRLNMLQGQMCSTGNQHLNLQTNNQVGCNDMESGHSRHMVSPVKHEVQPCIKQFILCHGQKKAQEYNSQATVETKVPIEIGKHSNWQKSDQKQSILHDKPQLCCGEEPLFSGSKGKHLHQDFPPKPHVLPFTNIQMDDRGTKLQGTSHREDPWPRKGQKEKHYSKNTHDNHSNHNRGTRKADFRQPHYNQGMCGRPNQQELHCAPCDRAFGNQGDFNAHLKSHVKCSEEGCRFEASGKIVKEHKVAEHGKAAVTTLAIGHKVLALRSMEDKDEVSRWREERKNNYPTLANVNRKAEQKKNRETVGLLFDEELRNRHEQMKEVLDRQTKLGVHVVEIPPKYLMPRNDDQQQPGRPGRSVENKEYNMVSGNKSGNANKRPFNANSHACKTPVGNDDTLGADEKISPLEEKSQEIENPDDDKVPPIRTERDQIKPRRERVPRRKRRKKHVSSHDTMQLQQRPSLLSELLKRDAGKELGLLLWMMAHH